MSRIPWREQRGDTLCWHCANAYGGCSWSQKDGKPVEGWDAFRIDINFPYKANGRMRPRQVESYVVVDCPKLCVEDRFAEDFASWSKRKAIVLAQKKRREQRKRK